LLAEEPEKRYVARFPRSQIPLLQVLSLVAIPLALLLLAIILPDQTVRAVAGRPLPELLTSYSPWRALFILSVLLLLYSAVYTVVALAVIFFIPIAALEREQPDYLITDPEGIARYDYKGQRAERLAWSKIQRWIRVDRRLWERPIPLFSMTFLESDDRRDLRIDGITGWYTSVQDDIGRRLIDAGNPLTSEDLGFRVLRSKMSLLPLIGLPLLVLFLAAESGWADWLVRLLPPPIYAASAFVVFSGVLILIALAYWLATKPLALYRTVGLKDRWPQIVGAAGLGAIVLYVLARGATFQQTRSLYIGLLVWGAYILADAATTLLAPRNRVLRVIIIAAAMAVALVVAYPRIEAIYTETLNQVAARRAVLLNESQPPTLGVPPPAVGSAAQAVEAGDAIANAPQYSPEQKAQAYVNNGRAYYAVDDYRSAAQAYKDALDIYLGLLQTNPESESLRQATAVALTGYARSLQKLGDHDWARWLAQACALDASVAPECPQQ
jgi:hypothetical protein